MFSKPHLLCLLPFALLSACDKREAPSAASSATAAPVDSATMLERTLAGAEAKAHLIAITRGVMAAALKVPTAGDLPTDDDKGAGKKLPDSMPPVPASADAVKGKAYKSKPTDWEAWAAIGFRLNSPQKCQYAWTREEDTKGYASAKCDFDGDGSLDLHAKQAVSIIDGAPKVGVLEEVVSLKK
ncbi:MAG: hypothetical protein AB7S68_25060 [Polyangiaceae bacterium]